MMGNLLLLILKS
uniref:Uncharacterized protein n=1 Tax=Arundo donax TaxID=35708 RepID=A0A0A8Z0G4_ARUDO